MSKKGSGNSGLLIGQARMHENTAEKLRKGLLVSGNRHNPLHPDFRAMSDHIQKAAKLHEQHRKAVKTKTRLKGLRK